MESACSTLLHNRMFIYIRICKQAEDGQLNEEDCTHESHLLRSVYDISG